MRSIAGGALLLALAACGPTWTHQPLVGEDEETIRMLGFEAEDLETPETVAVAERFYRELWSSSSSGIWRMLSADSKSSLEKVADKLDSNGRALLKTREFPTAKGGKVKVSLAALFMVRRPTSFVAEGKPGPSDDSAAVVVRNREGDQRRVELKRERGTWKIHHTAYDDLPPSRSLRPDLLPKVKPKTPPAEPDDPPAVEEEEEEEEEEDEEEEEEEAEEAEPAEREKEGAPDKPKPDLDF